MGVQDPLETVTHARLRAEQGDVRGARRILERRLARDPGDEAARGLLRDLDPARHVERDRVAESPESEPAAASARELARRFRAGLAAAEDGRALRLRRLLRRIESGLADRTGPGGRR